MNKKRKGWKKKRRKKKKWIATEKRAKKNIMSVFFAVVHLNIGKLVLKDGKQIGIDQ